MAVDTTELATPAFPMQLQIGSASKCDHTETCLQALQGSGLIVGGHAPDEEAWTEASSSSEEEVSSDAEQGLAMHADKKGRCAGCDEKFAEASEDGTVTAKGHHCTKCTKCTKPVHSPMVCKDVFNHPDKTKDSMKFLCKTCFRSFRFPACSGGRESARPPTEVVFKS